MSLLITADAATRATDGTRLDLLGVGDVHTVQFVVYIELDDDDLAVVQTHGASLEAEGILETPKRLLLREIPATDGDAAQERLLWLIRRVPAGIWRLRLVIGGVERAARVISVGA